MSVPLCLFSCSGGPQSGLADNSALPQTAALYERLEILAQQGIMLGHQDDLSYGHQRKEEGFSDVKDMTGSLPAVLGMDLGHIELGGTHNIDSVSFDYMREQARIAAAGGGVVTFSWHARNVVTGDSAWDVSRDDVVSHILTDYRDAFCRNLDAVADFLLSLKGDDGELIPVVLRLFHEQTSSWFWWGAGHCSPEEYNELWKLTVRYLRDVRGVHNVLYAISPSEFDSEEQFLARYPGDEWVDILGFDLYLFSPVKQGLPFYKEKMKSSLEVVSSYAHRHGKPYIVAETGMEGVRDAAFFTKILLPLIRDYDLSWILFWRNAWEADKPGHFYLPYKGHFSEQDFLDFTRSGRILLMEDLGKTAELDSPDGRISFTLRNNPGVLPCYSIQYDGRTLVDNAAVGLRFTDWTFGPCAKADAPEYSDGTEVYDLVSGKASHVEERYNEVRIPFSENGRRVDLLVRAFDSGIGFRYEFPEQKGWKKYCLTDELTTFDMSGNPQVLTMYLGSYTTSHEGFYTLTGYDSLQPDALMEMPTLFCFDSGPFVAVTEAAVRDYAGSYLSYSGGHLTDKLSPLPGQEIRKVEAALPHRTPWRCFMIGSAPGDLICSNLLTSLNDPCAIGDVSWIRPGKTTFSWWNGNIVADSTFMAGNNFMTNRYYIDFAASHGLQYHSIYGYAEQPWYYDPAMDFGNPAPDADITKPVRTLDMEYIGRYAAGQGVGIHLWVNWRPFYEKIDEALELFGKWGVKGMMVDFMDRDDQEMIRIQEDILRKTAQHGMFVQFHGACKPSGLNRTYPNEFTREGTRNYECFKWSADMGPDLDIAIPFTRLLAGATDYHLGGFRAVNRDDFEIRYQRPLVMCSRCHMLGMYVVLESYLGMVCDYPDAYIGEPGFEFISEVPCTWDETRVPAAELMQYVCVARRSGRDWWLGAINNSTAREIDFVLDFLEEGTVYEATVFCDASDSFQTPDHLVKKRLTVSHGDHMTLDMVSGGGAAVHIRTISK